MKHTTDNNSPMHREKEVTLRKGLPKALVKYRDRKIGITNSKGLLPL